MWPRLVLALQCHPIILPRRAYFERLKLSGTSLELLPKQGRLRGIPEWAVITPGRYSQRWARVLTPY